MYTDKFYTSIPLAKSLLCKGIYLCGSINHTRKQWPHQLKPNKTKKKADDAIRSLKRGESIQMQSSDTSLTATVWKDSALVSNLSTCHGPTYNKRDSKLTRKIRTEEGTVESKEFSCPPCIVDFNKFMGGVDRHDHLRSSYTLQRASSKWWHYFMWFATDVALINAYILYRESHPKCAHKKFQLQVISRYSLNEIFS